MFLSIIVLSPYDFCDYGERRCCSLSVTPKSVIRLHVALSILCIPVFSPSFYFYWRKALSANQVQRRQIKQRFPIIIVLQWFTIKWNV